MFRSHEQLFELYRLDSFPAEIEIHQFWSKFGLLWVKQTLSTFIWTQVESTERAMAHSYALIKGFRSVCGDPSLVRPASQKSHVKAEPHGETPESLSFEHGFTRMRFSRAQMIGFQL